MAPPQPRAPKVAPPPATQPDPIPNGRPRIQQAGPADQPSNQGGQGEQPGQNGEPREGQQPGQNGEPREGQQPGQGHRPGQGERGTPNDTEGQPGQGETQPVADPLPENYPTVDYNTPAQAESAAEADAKDAIKNGYFPPRATAIQDNADQNVSAGKKVDDKDQAYITKFLAYLAKYGGNPQAENGQDTSTSADVVVDRMKNRRDTDVSAAEKQMKDNEKDGDILSRLLNADHARKHKSYVEGVNKRDTANKRYSRSMRTLGNMVILASNSRYGSRFGDHAVPKDFIPRVHNTKYSESGYISGASEIFDYSDTKHVPGNRLASGMYTTAVQRQTDDRVFDRGHPRTLPMRLYNLAGRNHEASRQHWTGKLKDRHGKAIGADRIRQAMESDWPTDRKTTMVEMQRSLMWLPRHIRESRDHNQAVSDYTYVAKILGHRDKDEPKLDDSSAKLAKRYPGLTRVFGEATTAIVDHLQFDEKGNIVKPPGYKGEWPDTPLLTRSISYAQSGRSVDAVKFTARFKQKLLDLQQGMIDRYIDSPDSPDLRSDRLRFNALIGIFDIATRRSALANTAQVAKDVGEEVKKTSDRQKQVQLVSMLLFLGGPLPGTAGKLLSAADTGATGLQHLTATVDRIKGGDFDTIVESAISEAEKSEETGFNLMSVADPINFEGVTLANQQLVDAVRRKRPHATFDGNPIDASNVRQYLGLAPRAPLYSEDMADVQKQAKKRASEG